MQRLLSIFLLAAFVLPFRAAADQLPHTQDTAEGVAVLMAKAFIDGDSALWRSIQNPKFTRKSEMQSFVADIATQMDQIRKLDPVSRPGPRKITKIHTLGRLSANGPNSYSYAVFNFKEIGFVDVAVKDSSGNESNNRTFVCQDQDSKWYVLPRPDLFPLLTMGLNQEPVVSKIAWSE